MKLEKIIQQAFQEDIGEGDHTTLACIPENKEGTFQLHVKEDGILAGMRVVQKVFEVINPQLEFSPYLSDGDTLKKGDLAFKVTGRERSILQAERLALNFMQRMSGIATKTAQFVKQTEGTKARILDTRKTTPGLRDLEKEAVKLGGGTNHRSGLYDLIMLKDNHIDCSDGISNALRSVRNYLDTNHLNLPIEIEARNLKEVEEILENGPVDFIMLDNFDYLEIEKAVDKIRDNAQTEASGGIGLEEIRAYAKRGVDFISVGELTHSFRSLDLSLKSE